MDTYVWVHGCMCMYMYVYVTTYDTGVCISLSLSNTVGVVSHKYRSYFVSMGECIHIVTWCWHGVYLYMCHNRYIQSIFLSCSTELMVHHNGSLLAQHELLFQLPVLPLGTSVTTLAIQYNCCFGSVLQSFLPLLTLQLNWASTCHRCRCFSNCCSMHSKHKCVVKY